MCLNSIFRWMSGSENYQKSNNLRLIGFNSISTLENISMYFAIGFIAIFLYLTLKITLKFFIKCNWWKLLVKPYEKYWSIYWIIGLLIRYILLGCLLTLISSVYEIKYNIMEGFTLFAIIPIFIFALWIAFTIFTILVSIWIVDKNKVLSKFFEELFKWVKMGIFSRLYQAFFLTHKILIVICLAAPPSAAIFKIAGVAFLQIIFIAFLAFVRPFNTTVANVQKIYKESWFLALWSLSLGFYYDSVKVSYIIL